MITIEKSKDVKTISDDMNPRIFNQEYECFCCQEWYDPEEIIETQYGFVCSDCFDKLFPDD